MASSFSGRRHTEESRKKISEHHADVSGEKNPRWGIPMSDELKAKLLKANLGRKLSEEHKKKIGGAGRGRVLSDETKAKMSKSKTGVPRPDLLGKKASEETRKKISESRRGNRNYFWQGGGYIKHHGPGFTESLKKSIRARDGFVCMICGAPKNGKSLSVHHIDYSKDNHETTNLVTLCPHCHSLTNNNRDKWLLYFGKGENGYCSAS